MTRHMAGFSCSSSWAPPQPPSHSLSVPRAAWLKPRSWGTTRAPRSQAACIGLGLQHPRLQRDASGEGVSLETGVCTRSLAPGPSPPNSCSVVTAPWCVSLPASPGSPPPPPPPGPASVAGNLQRSKAWIPPWVSPHAPLFPLSRAHFCPALSFFPVIKSSDG